MEADPPRQAGRIIWAIHVAVATWIAAFVALAYVAPGRYYALVQEDRFVEWWTVGLFVAAGVAWVRGALRPLRVFDLLVAGFCFIVAGEEMSWGQRLLGFTPPDVFLEHNYQQELTLHNFRDMFGQPKGPLMLALAGFGLLLPALGRLRRVLPVMQRAGATPPPVQLVPWFIVAIGLLYVYPFSFTSEWVEAMAGGLFLAAAWPASRRLVITALVTAALAVGLTVASAQGWPTMAGGVACAEREAQALAKDIASGRAAGPRLISGRGSVHKRIWTAIQQGYVHGDSLRAFTAVGCGRSPEHVIDPWGLAYWMRVSRPKDGQREVAVYSMGPNRRRDSRGGGDDVVATASMEAAGDRP